MTRPVSTTAPCWASKASCRNSNSISCEPGFPGRHRSGSHAGELYWNSLCHDQVLNILHNPAYAGAYVYGRARHTTDLDGRPHTLVKPPGDWTVVIHDHHPGYLTWTQYQANQQTLAANAAAHGHDRKAGPAREGPPCSRA